MLSFRNFCLYVTVIWMLLMLPLIAQSSTLAIELNKVEQRDQACRVYLVTNNRTQQDFKSLKLDMVLFDQSGVIHKNMAIQLAPLPIAKKSVKAFDLKNLTCEAVGSILINQIIQCETGANAPLDCLSLLQLSSKNEILFSK